MNIYKKKCEFRFITAQNRVMKKVIINNVELQKMVRAKCKGGHIIPLICKNKIKRVILQL